MRSRVKRVDAESAALHSPAKARELPAGDSAWWRIVAVARHQFLTHGLRGVTMDDLARELGMSKKTLYAHFPNKTALLEAVLLEKFRDAEADLDRIMSGDFSDFPAVLHELLACVQRHTEEIQPPFLRDLRRETPQLDKLMEDRRRTMIQRYFGRLFDHGQRAGVIRKDVPAALVTEILLASTRATMSSRDIKELGLGPNAGVPTVIRVIVEGLLTQKGRLKR